MQDGDSGGRRDDGFLYEGPRTAAISFPLGGIGTGCIGLSGAGRLIDWEVFNRPAKGSLNGFSHFAVRAEQDGRLIDARVLNGPLRDSPMGSLAGDAYRNFGFGAARGALAGMPHFRDNDFNGRFPVACLGFTDPDFPGGVTLTAFNPFIPGNERDSGLPAAFFEIGFSNPTPAPITYTVAGVLAHGIAGQSSARPVQGKGWQGLVIDNDLAVDDGDRAQLLIATDAAAASRQTCLHRGLWYDALEVYWRQLCAPGPFADRVYADGNDAGGMIRDLDHSLQAGHIVVPPGGSGSIRMLIGWHVPNFQKYWISPVWHFKGASLAAGQWRNWYATQWPDAAAVAAEAFERWNGLRADTFAFRDTLYASTLPHAMLDAAAANLSTLKSPTVLRLEDGTLYGWEGCHPHAGSCEGSCTHVWNYQQAVAFLFPRLSRSMRTADYRFNLDADGKLSFRLGLPLGSHLSTEHACVDGQLGNIMVLYRDWKLCGDDDWLRELWPAVGASLDYVSSPGNPDRWDPERTGVLWGRQHHTLDMELFGPSAWLSGFYVGALSAAAEMAEVLGEPERATEFRARSARGRQWIDENLFNGRYFVQRLDLGCRPVLDRYSDAERSRRLMGASIETLYWSEEFDEIKYQIGDGCFIDQLSSQWHAGLYGLPAIFEADKARSALAAIHRHNFKPELRAVPNPGRVLGFGDEAGTIACAWPEGARQPAISIPYAQETLHGMEYSAGIAMLQHGLAAEAIAVFAAVRDRYDGSRRNPWSEMECGSNYARSLASWGVVIAAAGYRFDARRGHIGFDPLLRDGDRFAGFWSAAEAWGRITLVTRRLTLEIVRGRLTLESLGLPALSGQAPRLTRNGEPIRIEIDGSTLRFAPLALKAGDVLAVDAEGLTLGHATDVAAFRHSGPSLQTED